MNKDFLLLSILIIQDNSSLGLVLSEEIIFKIKPIKNKIFPWWPCLFSNLDQMRKLYTEPSIGASYQISIDLA
jgi:hypothetical protein